MSECTKDRRLFGKQRDALREVYEYRFVYFNLVRRNLEGRYNNTLLGLSWHFFVPILTIVLYYVVFTAIKTRPIEDFAFYLCVGVFPLNFISSCMYGRAIVANRKFITKMYFPREIVVMADVTANFITFIIIYACTVLQAFIIRPVISFEGMLFLGVALLLLSAFGYGCSLLFSTLSVLSSDFSHLVNPLLSLTVWVTPTFFLVSDVSGILYNIIWYNPMTYFVESFHSILYFGTMPTMMCMVGMVVMTIGMLGVGTYVFNRYRDRFPEIL